MGPSADPVYCTTGNGGGACSTGFLSGRGCLAHNGCDNDVSRTIRNILTRCAAGEALLPLD